MIASDENQDYMFCRVLRSCCAIYDSVLFLSATVDNLLEKIQSLSLIKKHSHLYYQTFNYKCPTDLTIKLFAFDCYRV